jgi:hypothetical protein
LLAAGYTKRMDRTAASNVRPVTSSAVDEKFNSRRFIITCTPKGSLMETESVCPKFNESGNRGEETAFGTPFPGVVGETKARPQETETT